MQSRYVLRKCLAIPLFICSNLTRRWFSRPLAQYGKKDGIVLTEVRYSTRTKELELDVINSPGPKNDELVAMGYAASEKVFAARTRLHDGDKDEISSGDGAWIMQKCANTLGGKCQIQFQKQRTVFSFRCTVDVYQLPWQRNEAFEVPSNTWGLAIDDSSIQRRLMKRILASIGVHPSKLLVMGESPEEADVFGSKVAEILRENPSDYVFALVDENMDYKEQRISGSSLMQNVLLGLSEEESSRALVLIRSANDSAEDVALYKSRVHGFFPKTTMTKERSREIAAPLWRERFGQTDEGEDGSNDGMSTVTNDMITKAELMGSLMRAQKFIDEEVDVSEWTLIWSYLHSLLGDLRVADDFEDAVRAAELINSMRGGEDGNIPKEFKQKWEEICELTIKTAGHLKG